MNAATCPICGTPKTRGICERCRDMLPSLATCDFDAPAGLAEAVPEAGVAPVSRDETELPPAAGGWRSVASASEVPRERHGDLSLALALLEEGVWLDDVNRHLLARPTGQTDLAKSFARCRECPGAVLARALEASARLEADPVARFGEWRCSVHVRDGAFVVRAPDVPAMLGPFRLVCRIGQGGMGEVFLGQRDGLAKDFALKRFKNLRRTNQEARFAREVEALARLRHPGIVSLVDADLAGSDPYLAMEFVAGEHLAARIRSGIAIEDSARLVEEVARAIAHAHRQGVLHRDVKPQNVLIDLEGRSCLVDFGLARLRDRITRVTAAGVTLGTPQYMAPETLGDPEAHAPASDVYSLGVVLYECLTGRRPFDGNALPEIFDAIRAGSPPAPRWLVPRVPRELEALALACLATDPGSRPASADAVAAALASWRERLGARREIRRLVRRWGALTVVAAVLVVALTLLAIIGP